MKILCIDMNIIMAPCIRLYEDRVSARENPEIGWINLERTMGIGAHLLYDTELLLDIARLIKNNKNAVFAVTEQQKDNVAVIEEVMHEIKCGDSQTNDSIHVTNIDFFCDAGRPEDRSRFDFGVYSDDSWLGYLAKKYPEMAFTWVKAPGSAVPECACREQSIEIASVSDIAELPQDHDLIILTCTQRFVPYRYRHLGDLLGVCAG